jgi:hypothetical protein
MGSPEHRAIGAPEEVLRAVKGGCPHHSSRRVVRRVGLATIRGNKRHSLVGRVEPLFRIPPPSGELVHQSKPLTSFDDSTEGASGRRCAFLFAESALHEGSSVVQWSWLQVGERLRARRPHWTMTRGVACWSEPYLRALRRPKKGSTAQHQSPPAKGGPSPARPAPLASSVFVALPARAAVTGRARTKAAVLLLACVFDDRNERSTFGSMRSPFTGRRYITNGASTSPSRSNK